MKTFQFDLNLGLKWPHFYWLKTPLLALISLTELCRARQIA